MKNISFIILICLMSFSTYAQNTVQFQKIHKDSTSFRFEIKTDLGDQKSDYLFIYRDSLLVQELTDFKRNQSSYAGDRKIIFEDINFDGYLDLKVQAARGSVPKTEGRMFREAAKYHVWLYQPATSAYLYSKEISNFPQFRLDPAQNELVVEEYILYSHCQYSSDHYRYKWIDGRLSFQGHEHHESRSNPNIDYENDPRYILEPIEKIIEK